MPRVKQGPFKWTIYYTHVPIWWGTGKDRRMVLDPLIFGWWGLDAWCDWEYRAVYDTKEEAEREIAEIVASDPERWAGVVHAAPTLKLKGEEAVLSVIKAERERRDWEIEENERKWKAKYDAEVARLNRIIQAEFDERRKTEGRAHQGKA